MEEKRPTYGQGKICYLEIPAIDVNVSAAFYQVVFGWKIRREDNVPPSFDDGVGEVSGMWITDRPPMATPGIIISIMVKDAEATMKLVEQYGGVILHQDKYPSGEFIVHFKDPAGNFMGIYQERVRG